MTADNTCPICGFQGISADKAKCPQCDADISCFRVLDSLPDTVAPERPVTRQRSIVGAGIVLLLCVILGGFLGWVFRDKEIKSLMSYRQIYPVSIRIDMEAELERRACQRRLEAEAGISIPTAIFFDEPEMVKGLKGEDRELPTAEEKKQAAEESPEKAVEQKDSQLGDGFWTYHAAADDTLWRISAKYYGTGTYFPVLLKDNPGMGIYDLRKDLGIRILRDPRLAEQVYEEITTKDGTRIYYLYMVEKGDTLESIARRFYGKETMVDRLHLLNPDMGPNPGEKVRIELE